MIREFELEMRVVAYEQLNRILPFSSQALHPNTSYSVLLVLQPFIKFTRQKLDNLF